MNALIVMILDAIDIFAARHASAPPRVLLGIKDPPFFCRHALAQHGNQMRHFLIAP